MTAAPAVSESIPTKQRLLEAAEDLFAVGGFDGTSVEEITKRANANRAAVSFHFGGKERLYIEAVKYAHRNCIQGAPFPEWPAGTPLAERLRGFIRTMMIRMTTDISPASAQLMMREMVQPTAACEEVVRDYIRPAAGVLVAILDEMLPPEVPYAKRYLMGFSVVAQCLFYRTHRPIAALLIGEDEFKKLDVEVLTEHVTEAALAMIEANSQPAAAAEPRRGAVMNWVALRMLTGDRSKYLGIIFGVTFATLLMAQQMSIFAGIMGRTGSQIVDVGEADIWVMDSRVRFIDEIPALPEDTLQRVRGVDGVAWAVKLYKGNVRVRLEGGNFRNAILFGLDDATLVGAPPKMLAGRYDDLRIPDAVIVDKAGYEYMWPEEKDSIKTEGYKLGKLFEMNDRRAVLVGVCQVSMPFISSPILYTRYSQATLYAPRERNLMSFVLAKAAEGVPPETVGQRIEKATQVNRTGDDDRRLLALTGDQFFWKTIWYFMGSTGIPINFGITILLGFIVGVAIAGQTFYLFTLENLKQFGSLKAMGLTNRRILGMILLQAFVAGAIGYCLGLGLTATYFETISRQKVELEGMYLYPQVALLVAGCVTFICLLASLLSARKVLVLEPAIVFRG